MARVCACSVARKRGVMKAAPVLPVLGSRAKCA